MAKWNQVCFMECWTLAHTFRVGEFKVCAILVVRKMIVRYSFHLMWAVLSVSGFLALWQYALKPGETSQTLQQWPEKSGLSHSREKPQLVLFVHPRCPCSKATLAEVAEITAVVGKRLHTQIVFVLPGNTDQTWGEKGLYKSAMDLPLVDVVQDLKGKESVLFGAKTSGHAFFFDGKGKLVFSGGITPARGHQGDNIGKSAVLDFFNKGMASRKFGPVFGCPLFSEEELAKQKEATCCSIE
jgi:hypothetical protein